VFRLSKVATVTSGFPTTGSSISLSPPVPFYPWFRTELLLSLSFLPFVGYITIAMVRTIVLSRLFSLLSFMYYSIHRPFSASPDVSATRFLFVIRSRSRLTCLTIYAIQNDFPKLKYAILGLLGFLALVQRE
jgi:hypothetical protein